jgi:tRNA 2-thiouridine synthesizing protein B
MIMNSLQIIAKAPTSASIAELSAIVDEGDVLIFIEDGIYFARTEFSPSSAPRFKHLECYFLEEDLAARGIDILEGMQTVDTRGFVALSARLPRSVSWY